VPYSESLLGLSLVNESGNFQARYARGVEPLSK
jgi:hypothetical protein